MIIIFYIVLITFSYSLKFQNITISVSFNDNQVKKML